MPLAPELPNPVSDPRDESVGDLVGRLVADGKAYARSEVALYKAVAKRRVGRAKRGILFIAIGVVLILCSLTALVLALVLGLATLIGPFAAGMAVFVALALIGGLLAKAGAGGLAALGGDDEEKAALAIGEASR